MHSPMRSILQPVLVPVDYEYGDVLNPLSLFAAGALDFWYDPSDFSTMFQDAAGMTPVTAVGQPVGLELDKSKGLALGAERWVDGSASFVGDSYRVSPNVYRIYSPSGGYSAAIYTSGQTSGKWYEANFTVDSITVLGDGVSVEGTPTTPFTTTGRKTCRYLATSNNIIFKRAATACDIQISNISVRELPGNHAYQQTALSRPTVQSGYNAFDKTDDHLLCAAGGGGTTGFLLACGVVVPAAGTARTIFSDRGTNAGYKLGIDATNKIVFSGGTGAGHTTLTSANALTTGHKYAVIAWHDGTNLNLSINGVPEPPVACGTVTAGTSTLTIGKDNGSASGYWGNSIYTAVYRRNDSSSAAQRSGLYTYIVGKMGGL